MVPRTQSAAVGAHRREAVHRRLAAPEEVAVVLPLPRGPDCLVHRRRTRTRPPGGRRTAGRRNTNSHRPTTNSRSVPSGTRRDRHAQAPKQRGRNGGGQSDGACPPFPALRAPLALDAPSAPLGGLAPLWVPASLAEAVAPLPTTIAR